MRVRLVLLILFVCGLHTTAWAEKAKAREASKVYSRAGEQGKVVLKIKKGQVMRIDRKQGRWYKVRVSGRTGWIPRSKVDVLEEEEIARNTRRRPFVDGRGTKRGFGGGEGPSDRVGADAVDPDTSGGGGDDDDDDDDTPKPRRGGGDDDDDDDDGGGDDGDTEGDEPKGGDDDEDEGAEIVDDRPRVRVTGKAKIYSEPDEDSDEAEWEVKSGMVLFVTGKKGKFIEVENDEADIGFILSSKTEEVDSDDGDGGGPKASQMDVRGRLGVTIIQQGLRSDGQTGFPDNYNLSTSAATIALGGAYMRPYGKKYVLGAEANFDIAKAIPGIKDPEMGNNIGVTLWHVNVRGMVGLDLKKKSGMIVFGRLGLRYQSYQVSKDLSQNTLGLPSEILTTPSIGAALAMPTLTPKIGLRFSLDTVIAGASVKQTKNLEDGEKASGKGAIIGAGFTYRWKPEMDIQATYDFNYMTYNFGAPIATSNRGHMGTGDVKRTDIFHGLTVGVAKAF